MKVPATLKCKHCLMKVQYPTTKVSNHLPNAADIPTHLEGHQQTFTFNIRKAQVDTAWIAFDIPISYDVFNLQIDFIDESIRELLDVSMISLLTKLVRKMITNGGSSKSEPLHENHWQAGEMQNIKVLDDPT
jgi:hypothetical protein